MENIKITIWEDDSEKVLLLPILSKKSSKKVHAGNESYHYEGSYNKKMEANGPDGTLRHKHPRKDSFHPYSVGVFKNGQLVKGVQYDGDGGTEFSGYFRNGKLHGKGKEFVGTGESYIEGVFTNGKINGKGQEFEDGNLIHVGGFKGLLYDGKGKQYYENGQVRYDATWKNGRLDGKGKKFSSDGKLMYEGNWKNDRYDGKGKLYETIIVGDRYEDTYTIGKFDTGHLVGKATQYYKDDGKIASKMNYVRGRKDGKGVRYYTSGKIFQKGEWKRGQMNGKCVEYSKNGKIKKEGIFQDGYLVKGRRCDYDGYCYVGKFERNDKVGRFKIYYPSGKLYETATFKRDREDGLVKKFHENGKVQFKGHYDRGGKKGRGVEYYEDGKKKYDGYYNYGKPHGRGKSYFENGKLSFDGTYYIGTMKKGIKYETDGSFIKGTFDCNKPDGECAFYNPQKKLIMKGKFSNGIKNGEVKIYRPNGKLEFKGMFHKNKKNGPGTEYNEQGKVVRKGFWKDDKYEGKVDITTLEKTKRVEQNNIKKYLQTNDNSFLKQVNVDSMKEYLKKYANKTVKGSKPKLIKELQQWRKQIKKEKPKQKGMVFDAYEGDEVPIKDFVQDENRVLFVSENGHYDGAYLEQCQIVYECEEDRSWRSYVGDPKVRSIIQFPTASGPKYYFESNIVKSLDKGYNVFHYETEPKSIRILSKSVALGGSIVSGLHCDEKDVVKVSKVTKMEKLGKGLTKTVNFEF